MMRLVLLLLLAGLAPTPANAVDIVPATASNPWTVWMPVVITTVPVVVMYFKRFFPARYAPLIPVVAVALGPAVDWVLSWLAGKAADPTAGVMYGGLAVALREVVDQVRRADWSPASWTPSQQPQKGANP